jgi:hypothetical protein
MTSNRRGIRWTDPLGGPRSWHLRLRRKAAVRRRLDRPSAPCMAISPTMNSRVAWSCGKAPRLGISHDTHAAFGSGSWKMFDREQRAPGRLASTRSNKRWLGCGSRYGRCPNPRKASAPPRSAARTSLTVGVLFRSSRPQTCLDLIVGGRVQINRKRGLVDVFPE